MDLEVNGNNPLHGPLVAIDNMAPEQTCYQDIVLHLTDCSNPGLVRFRLANATCTWPIPDNSVVHTYGQPEKNGSIDVPRSNDSLTTYDYEAKEACVKFQDALWPLGEDDLYSVGMTDTFVVTFINGSLPVTCEVKTGAGEEYFTFTAVGETYDVYHDGKDGPIHTYTVRLVSKQGYMFTFEAESIAKAKKSGLSHIMFCFTPDMSAGCLLDSIQTDLSIVDTSSDRIFVIQSLDQHITLRMMNNTWYYLTTPATIPAFIPCTDYILIMSFHLSAEKYAVVTFDLEFCAEQTHNGGAGLSDHEKSRGNNITASEGSP